tara:strand:+ start:4371 stop:4964 length:594 start_codon:yes stop_codon:yes gene_type:complete
MTKSRSKTEVLSKTAQSYIKSIAKQDFYGYNSEINTKQMTKGTDHESTSIELYNSVFFTDHQKNTERITTEFLTGECDINTGSKIIDIKSSWSLETFPATPSDIDAKDYEWQLRGYMMLYDVDSAELAYCIIDTPSELLNDWDNHSVHKVLHIAPEHRVTTLSFERDEVLEEEIKYRCIAAQEFYKEYINQLNNKNK